jgi:CBS domain-containing protein
MKNPVAQNVADFLKHFPPFSYLQAAELYDIAQHCRLLYVEKNEALFKGGTPVHTDFYIVKDGVMGLSLTSDAEEMLIDRCDEGDILGLRPFFAKNDYLMTAKAREDALVYALPIDIFEPYISANQQVLDFMLESFASQTRNPRDRERTGRLLAENTIQSEQEVEIQYFQPIKYTRNPITANPDDVLMYIAKTMANSQIGSVVIQKDQLPIGIITDRDLRSKIATGIYPITAQVHEVMTHPVITVPENISVAEAQMIMLKHNVGHLCVTKDGTDNTPIAGIISEHDVVEAQSNTPGVLLKQTRRASNNKELKYVREKLTDLIQNSIDKNIPVSYISNIVAEINIALTRRAIELAVEKIGSYPPVRFVWMNIGSQGRKEQLLRTDQDNALIFEDVSPEQHDSVKRYFMELAELVTESLSKVGYEFSPYNIVARNPKWCKSLTDWIKQYNEWTNTPKEKELEYANLFFDFDFIYGYPAIEDVLTQTITQNITRNKKFFAHLASDALKNQAALGFFRQFIVEGDGENKDLFDIKTRAIKPLVDAGRLLALSQGFTEITNTHHRFVKLAEQEPQYAELYEECGEAFNTLQRFRTENGLINDSNGRYINLNELSKTDKAKIKNCLQPIADVQDMIKNRFSLTYLS